MANNASGLSEFHWLFEVLQTVDVGVLVLDRQYRITAWNGFMENHSGIDSLDAIGSSLFDVFAEVSEEWFKHKGETVIQLRNRAFTTWEQRPYIFKFRNNRPITGVTEYMYQNCTFIPVMGTSGEVENLAVIVYDVTDIATSKLDLKAANERLEEISRTDALTLLYNRGYWEDLFRMEHARQQRKVTPLSLLMFDIDHFKRVNDTYGHQVGDQAIRMVAQTMRDNGRSTDIAGRYGGEEFTMVLLDSDLDSAKVFAERLRSAVENQSIAVGEATLKVTISIGLAQWHPGYKSPDAWLAAADEALYAAKNAGRNNTQIAPEPKGIGD